MTNTSDRLLEVDGLSIEAWSAGAWHTIVNDVSFHLGRGEVIGLVGESGGGKSTLGLASMGFLRRGCRPASGSIRFDGRNLLQMSPRELRALRGRQMAYVAQSAAASFNPALRILPQTIENFVLQGRGGRAEGKRAAIELFRALGLPDPSHFGERFPHQVSGGQLQRAMTAMAMVSDPQLIVFDEPTTALDVTTQVDVLGAIRKVVKDLNTACIYISHDLAVVSQMADRVIVLKDGMMIEEQPTRSILASPQHSYTKSLWAVRELSKPEHAEPDRILEVRSVDASYSEAEQRALNDVSLSVPRGRTLALVGESGSGKSTLGRVIAGLLRPSNGEVCFNGHVLPAALGERGPQLLRSIQLIHQSADTALNPQKSVRYAIGRPIQLRTGLRGNALTAAVNDLLDMVELSKEHLDRLPSELSGGQMQRISIARALAMEPKLIICDEITSALDQKVQEDIVSLLRRLQEKLNTTYIFITHDLAIVRAIADEVAVMQSGRIVQHGMKSEVFAPPFHPYTSRLLSSVPEMDPEWLTQVLVSRTSETPDTEVAQWPFRKGEGRGSDGSKELQDS